MRVSRIIAVASLALTMLSCGSSGSTGSTGKVTVLLKDATADVKAAVITVAEVDLIGPDGNVVLTTTPVTTDLLTLANDVAKLVNGATVPAGPYSQLRFVITGGYLDVDGTIYASSSSYEGLPAGAVVGGELRMPSYDKSGLKVILPDGFTVGADSQLVVDFDVAQSFGHAAGGSGAWVMHPVVKAAEVADTASLQVTLSLGTETALRPADFQAVLTPAGGTQSTVLPLVGVDNGPATVTFQYLFPGDYTVSFQGPEGVAFTTDPAVPSTVTIVAGQPASASFLLYDAVMP